MCCLDVSTFTADHRRTIGLLHIPVHRCLHINKPSNEQCEHICAMCCLDVSTFTADHRRTIGVLHRCLQLQEAIKQAMWAYLCNVLLRCEHVYCGSQKNNWFTTYSGPQVSSHQQAIKRAMWAYLCNVLLRCEHVYCGSQKNNWCITYSGPQVSSHQQAIKRAMWAYLCNVLLRCEHVYCGSQKNFTDVCPQGSNWKSTSIVLDNGLAPNRRQAIIWTNADPINWRIYATQGGDELTQMFIVSVCSKSLSTVWAPKSFIHQ